MKLIVALIDFSDVTSDLITLAGDFALALKCRLVLLHVAMPDADFIDDHEREDVSRHGIAGGLRHRHHELAILEAEVKKLGIDATALMVRSDSTRGNPAAKILQELDRLAPDLIVLGSHGRGKLYQLLVGSITDAVVRRSSRPVVLVPTRRGSPTSKKCS